MDIEKLKELVFYAVDKASPRDLALSPETDTLAKIQSQELRAYGIMNSGEKIMWWIINANASPYAGAQPVPDKAQQNCKTVGDVWTAVCGANGITNSDGALL